MLFTVTHVKMESLVMKQLIPQTMTAVSVLALALAVGGCGSSGGGDDEMPPEPTPAEKQAMCESGGGRWNADMTCTSAEDLAQERATMQRATIKMKVMEAQTAVNAVNNDSTDAEVGAAEMAVAAAKMAIADAADVPAEEKAANTGTVSALEAQLSTAKMARMDAMDEAEMAEKMAMMKTAMKLYAGISAQMGDGTGNDDRFAAYSGTNDSQISVTFGDGSAAGTAIPLSEDKKTMVADNHGWMGKRYADPAGGDMVEAVVYSDVEAPKQGKKFGGAAADDEFQYALTDGMYTVDGTTATNAPLVGGSSFDHTAGVKEFKLPTNTVAVMIPGSFHGVSGTYSCTPTADNTCAAQVAAEGFTLGQTLDATNAFTASADAWTFKPSDANARVMSTADTMYASYGWWLHKTADGMTYTASAFFDYKGGDDDAELASGFNGLNGTATYMGGAAGKYALSSSTGGMNDAGHFTAKAMLEADFTKNMISGTIDNFVGADGMSRDWSVELMDTAVSATGVIAGDGTVGNTDRQMTKWTIGGTAGAASGEWAGQLYENGTDGVPKTAAGTFFSMYGMGNSMVGAFGANKQ